MTDVAGIDKEFDYLVPAAMAAEIEVGTEVRVALGPRRVGAWVVSIDDGADPPAAAASADPVAGEGRPRLRELARRRGHGPQPDLVDLAGWAAWRWAGRRATFLRAASADHAATRLPPPARHPPAAPERTPVPVPTAPGAHLLRLPPAADPTALVAAAAQLGPTLVVVPAAARAAVLAGRLRRAGADVALLPGEWEQARAGAAVVIGARAAAWGPCPDLAAAVVLDGHDEGLVQEGAPTWSALEVVRERCRRAGVPCLVVSACPTLEMLELGPPLTVEPSVERSGWAAVEVVDRRGDDPRLGLYSERLVKLVRDGGRVALVLNRTGRVRLLACGACGELGRCEVCAAAVVSPEPGRLQCPRCGHERPAVCARCGSTRVRNLRIGTARAREELEALAGRPVGEVSGPARELPDTDVIVGTEAVLHRLDPSSGLAAVAFVDFDQELLAGRVRAAEDALALLARASRLVRGRAGRIIVQTRVPDHPVVRAAVLADPDLVTDDQRDIRRALRLPPYCAVAVVHGPAAAEYAASLAGLAGLAGRPVEVVGPDGDRWLVRGADHRVLCDALAAAPRPAGAVRVAVDPPRL